MNFRPNATFVSSVIAVALIAHPVWAQLPVGLGGAAKEANSSRVQAQVQQRVATQAQARVQVEAARAAHIAQQAAVMAQQQAAAARQRASGGANVRANVDANVRSQTRVANQSAHANADARLGLQAGLTLPPGITKADVQIYDNIFGRFNPLRPQPAPQSNVNSPRNENSEKRGSDRSRQVTGENSSVWSEVDLATRIEVAARHRRAEISEMRDRALATTNAQLLLHAEQTEEVVNAFVEAQTQIRAEAETAQRQNDSNTETHVNETRRSNTQAGSHF